MIIKRKSLIVALTSSFIISLVLILTLIAYLIYIELKGEEFKRSYRELLQKSNAAFYSRYIETTKLSAVIESAGPLKGKAVIEGNIKNTGRRTVTDLLIKVRFLDKDDAVIYEVVFHPQEPPLGISSLTQVNIPYLTTLPRLTLKPGDSLSFKRILNNCPKEIIASLRENSGFTKGSARWSGKLVLEMLSLDF